MDGSAAFSSSRIPGKAAAAPSKLRDSDSARENPQSSAGLPALPSDGGGGKKRKKQALKRGAEIWSSFCGLGEVWKED